MVPRSEEAFAEMGASSHVIPHPVRRANTAWALRFTWSGKDEINGQLERSGPADWEPGERWRAEQGRRTASPPLKPESFLPSWSGKAGPRLTPVPPAPGPAGPSRNRFAVRGHGRR